MPPISASPLAGPLLAGLAALALVACDSTKPLGPPTAVVAERVDASPVVSTADSAVVRVVYENGAGVPGASVAWTLTSASTSVAQGDATTDANGRATLRYVVDQAVRAYTLTVSSGDLPPIVLTLGSVAGPVASLAPAGDTALVTATVGSTLTARPTVKLLDAYGNVITTPGIAVTYTISGGGGSVSGSPSATDQQGVAGAGVSWTLGANDGLNTLVARAGAVSRTFIAYGITQSPDLSVSGTIRFATTTPPTVGDEAFPTACVQSTTPVASVVTSTEDRTTTMTVESSSTCSGGQWYGRFTVAGLSRGLHTVRVVATTTSGATATNYFQVFHDAPPKLTWLAGTPDLGLANPMLDYTIACEDDDPGGCGGPITLSIRSPGYASTLLASGSSPLTGSLSLAAYDGKKVTLDVRAKTNSGTISMTRSVYVETAPLSFVTGANGMIVHDYDPRTGGLLYSDDPDSTLNTGWWDTRFTAQVPGIAPASVTVPNVVRTRGRVTRTGAAFVAYSSPFIRIFHLRNGQLKENFAIPDPGAAPFDMEGRWMVYSDGTSLFRRDLDAGVELGLERFGLFPAAVAPNGDWTYEGKDHELSLYRAGTSTRLTFDNGALWNRAPKMDGVNTVWVKQADPTAVGGAQLTQRLMLLSGGAVTELAPAGALASYEANGGWTAWVHAPASAPSAFVLRVRSPAGQVSDVATFTGVAPTIEALGADGSVILRRSDGLHRVGAGGTLTRVASGGGIAVWRDGSFYYLRNGVYRLP